MAEAPEETGQEENLANAASTDQEAPPAVERRPRPLTERFQAAVAMVQSLPKEGPYMADNTTKLRFYALYKQAKEGPCNISKPGFWDLVGKAKWEAWNVCGNMNKEIAMQMYVEELLEMVKTIPHTKETEELLISISPFYEDEEEEEEEDSISESSEGEEGSDGSEGGEGEEGEGGTGRGETSLSSSVLHGIEDPDKHRKTATSAEEAGKVEGSDDEDETAVGGRGGGRGGREGDAHSASSSEDYQESFQDLQPGQTTGEGSSSPWHFVSPESISPSFELLSSEPEQESPETKAPAGGRGGRLTKTPEDPLPPQSGRKLPGAHSLLGGRGEFGSEFHEPVGSGFVGTMTEEVDGPTSRLSTSVTEKQRVGVRAKPGTGRDGGGKGSHRSAAATATTQRLSGGGGGSRGEGVIVARGTGDGGRNLTGAPRHVDPSTGAPLALEAVSSQITHLQERVQDILQQLSTLSLAVQGAVQQYYGPGELQQQTAGSGHPPRSRAERRRAMVRKIVHLSMLLLGWPLLAHTIITYFHRNYARVVPVWVWSALSMVYLVFSFILDHGGFPLLGVPH